MEIKKQEVYEINCFRLEEFIEKHLGFKPDIVCNLECSNDSYHRFDISKKLEDYEEEDLKLLLEDDEQCGEKVRLTYISPQLCLVELCRRNLIPEGIYYMEVCW